MSDIDAESSAVTAQAPLSGPAHGWRLRTASVAAAVDSARVFQVLYGRSRQAFWLDSSRAGQGRFSYLGDASGPHREVLVHRAGVERSVFDVLADRLAARALPADPELPFDLCGGYVGYLGYELKGELPGVRNRHRSPLPDAVWMAADRYLVVDHEEDRLWAVALCRSSSREDTEAADRWIATSLERALTVDASTPPRPAPAGSAAPPAPAAPPVRLPPGTDLAAALARPRDRYLADIDECRRLLRQGESYEICLTNTLTLPGFEGSPLALYQRQRLANPAPYAAYLRLGGTHVLCSSPERFLRVGRDRVAEAKPIKGTAARHPDPVQDAAVRAALAASPKERAENLMITDLLRNDLGQVCEPGSVTVPSFMAVESYETVHQLVSTIRGRLAPGHSAVSAARACFPGGSMTGAPKIRTMEILDRLETGPRGIYSGALGYFSLNGTADLNIVIRTAVAAHGSLTVGAGGAIVLDSDPEAEYEEMLLKARAPLLPLLPRAASAA